MQKYMYAILSPEDFFRVISTRKGKQKEKRIELAACQKGHTLKLNSNVKFSLFFPFFIASLLFLLSATELMFH